VEPAIEESALTGQAGDRRWARWLWVVLAGAALLVTLRVLAAGWMPPDDALRHAAKAYSGRAWSDVLVLRPEIHADSHPGWHRLLGWVHAAGVPTVHGLVVFEVVLLGTLVMGLPASFFRRPEAWAFSLLILDLFDPVLYVRLFEGRPYLVTMATLFVFCRYWPRLRGRTAEVGAIVLFVAMAALSTWLHGAFYLLAIPFAALLAAREWQPALRYALATFAGIVVGLLLTGSPIAFPVQTISQLVWSFASGAPPQTLVSEFRSWNGSPSVLLVVALLCVWRVARGAWRRSTVDSPVFWLALLGWALSFSVSRYWSDWGEPAILFWIASELDEVLVPLDRWLPRRRLLAVLALSGLFVLAGSADTGSRWSRSLGRRTYLPAQGGAYDAWLPERGGIVYNPSMAVFYRSFYDNPRGPWRYMVGFEPTWMPPADLAVLRTLMIHGTSARDLAPWLDRMKPQDRLVLLGTEMPRIERLEWISPRRGVWIGRLKRAAGGTKEPPASLPAVTPD
jgi:hypothetical protein